MNTNDQLIAAQLHIERLTKALEMMYDKWENGHPAYEDVEESGGFIGNIVNLSEDEENSILALIPSVLNCNSSQVNLDALNEERVRLLQEAEDICYDLNVANSHYLIKADCLDCAEAIGKKAKEYHSKTAKI